jgi:hypothetical protein
LQGPKQGRGRSRSRSTAADVLEGLALVHELPKKVLEYRELSKLKSTYADVLPRLIHPATGRVHTRFSQTGAVTGRLSSPNPNLQNIPIRTELPEMDRARPEATARRFCKMRKPPAERVSLRTTVSAPEWTLRQAGQWTSR